MAHASSVSWTRGRPETSRRRSPRARAHASPTGRSRSRDGRPAASLLPCVDSRTLRRLDQPSSRRSPIGLWSWSRRTTGGGTFGAGSGWTPHAGPRSPDREHVRSTPAPEGLPGRSPCGHCATDGDAPGRPAADRPPSRLVGGVTWRNRDGGASAHRTEPHGRRVRLSAEPAGRPVRHRGRLPRSRSGREPAWDSSTAPAQPSMGWTWAGGTHDRCRSPGAPCSGSR